MRALSVTCVLLAACAEQRFELIRAPSMDASVEVDAGPAPCIDETYELNERLLRAAVVATPAGPVAFGVGSGGVLRSYVPSDGGFNVKELSTSAADSAFNAIWAQGSIALAFHAGDFPSLARIDADGSLVSSPESVAGVAVGGNPGWGLRVSALRDTALVSYRTLGARAAFTSTPLEGGPLRHALIEIPSLGQADGVILGETVKLVFEGSGQVVERVVTLDGALVSQRVLALSPLAARPLACPAVSVYARSEADGGGSVEAVGDGLPFLVAAGLIRYVRGECAQDHTLAGVVVDGRLYLKRLAADGVVVDLASLDIPVIDDLALARDAVSVWVLVAPRFTTARLHRLCLSHDTDSDGGLRTDPHRYGIGCSGSSGAPGGLAWFAWALTSRRQSRRVRRFVRA